MYYIELEADIEERLRRNRTPLRLEHKPTKRDIEFSEKDLLRSASNHRLNSYADEIQAENYLKIHNTHLEPIEVAVQIQAAFNL